MGENMEKFRHLDGSEAVIERPYLRIQLQHGDPRDVGVNGCRIEDVVDALVDKLLDFQGRDLACDENATALYHLEMAREALVQRRRRREQQGVLGTRAPHRSEPIAAQPANL
jgi:hypothetical protein